MRVYVIGTLLLDLDVPTRVVGHSRTPQLSSGQDEQDGYVPNVVYTCGAMAHGDILVIPYGVADHRINFATASISKLLEAMTTSEHPTIVSKVRHRRLEDSALEV